MEGVKEDGSDGEVVFGGVCDRVPSARFVRDEDPRPPLSGDMAGVDA